MLYLQFGSEAALEMASRLSAAPRPQTAGARVATVGAGEGARAGTRGGLQAACSRSRPQRGPPSRPSTAGLPSSALQQLRCSKSQPGLVAGTAAACGGSSITAQVAGWEASAAERSPEKTRHHTAKLGSVASPG